MQIEKIDVCFVKGGKSYSFDCNGYDLKVNDCVVVDTIRGLELGYVTCEKQLVEIDDENSLKTIVRVADEKDLKQKSDNIELQKQYKEKTEKTVARLNLDMKIASVDLNLDRTKVLICFTSSDRVDFRELVKSLANLFKMRIELKQIGDRDETKLLGGLGPCGRPCCCNKFLNDFTHSTIKMAKNQGLSLNPTKISGLCGRLMCCLEFENNHYAETLKIMPKVGTSVKTAKGSGVVVYNNLLKKIVSVKIETKDNYFETYEFAVDEISF